MDTILYGVKYSFRSKVANAIIQRLVQEIRIRLEYSLFQHVQLLHITVTTNIRLGYKLLLSENTLTYSLMVVKGKPVQP